MSEIKLTFLTKKEVYGENGYGQLEIFKRHGPYKKASDFCFVLGAEDLELINLNHKRDDDWIIRGYCQYWTKTKENFLCVAGKEKSSATSYRYRRYTALPVLSFLNSPPTNLNTSNQNNEFEAIEYGEYPQTIVDELTNAMLNTNFNQGKLNITGKEYTINSEEYQKDKSKAESSVFQPKKLKEYEYNGCKYVRVKLNEDTIIPSDGETYQEGTYVWIKVEPIKWFKEPNKNLYIPEKMLFAGIAFWNYWNMLKYFDTYDESKFEETDINAYLQNYFVEDIIPSKTTKSIKKKQPFTISNFTFVDKDGNKKKKRIVVKVKSKN